VKYENTLSISFFIGPNTGEMLHAYTIELYLLNIVVQVTWSRQHHLYL